MGKIDPSTLLYASLTVNLKKENFLTS